jgi:hypothetical protein
VRMQEAILAYSLCQLWFLELQQPYTIAYSLKELWRNSASDA